MWKTTDRYVQQVGSPAERPRALRCRVPDAGWVWGRSLKPTAGGDAGAPLPTSTPPWSPADFSDVLFSFKKRLKAAEAESKLKQVYIPN